MSGNSNNRTSPGPRTARCDWSLPTGVRPSTVTVAASSLQWVTRMPSPNGARPHASATGHGGSPPAFWGEGAGAPRVGPAGGGGGPIVAAAGAGRGSNVRVGSAGSLADRGPQATVAAAAAATTIAQIPRCTGSPSHPAPTRVEYPPTCASIG